jgi:type II secretory pathway pseudopilin PulG
MRTLITTIGIGLAVVAPAAAAETRQQVTRAETFAAAQRIAVQSAAALEDQTATGIEELTNGAARIDRSRTSVGNYLRYSKFRSGASFALFGTNTVNGETRALWCIGNVEVVRAGNGHTRVAANVTCPVG